MRRSIVSLFIFSFVGLLTGSVRGDGFIIVADSPGVPGHFGFAPLEVVYHRVSVDIKDHLATTSVDQEFYNPNARQLEGTYIFPMPEGAHIDQFSMDINGKMMQAELLDADKARSIYEEIVRKYRDPALLEYIGRGAFKVRIFPIEASGKKQVKISYTQVLTPDSGLTEYVYPLNTEKFSARPLKDVSVKVSLSCDRPIKSIYSPSHDIDISRPSDRSAVIGFEARDVRPDTDFKLIYSNDEAPVGLSVLSYRNSPDDGYFLLMASPGTDVSQSQIQPKDICFVIDTSGSMAGPKMEQAKKALLFCLANLNERDRFQIIRFSTEAEPLNDGFVEATRENLDRAYAFVKDLKPRGGTAIHDALKQAIDCSTSARDGAMATIIFLTDGQPTIGQTNPDRIVELVRAASVPRTFSFGIGTDINTHLLDRIGNETRAFSQYVLPDEDIEVKVSNFYAKIQSPVLTDVKLAVADGSVRIAQVYPNVMPDLFKGQTLLAFGRYSGTGKAQVRMSGMIEGQSREFVSEVDFAEHDMNRSFIPRLWATRRVGGLLEEIRLNGETAELKDEVVRLAREHGIVTPYTAYLILEDERNRNVPIAMRTMRELESDTRAREVVFENYAARTQVAGEQAVADSASLQRMKFGANVQQSTASQNLGKPAEAGQSFGYKQSQNYAQQVRFVNGRAFYQNGQSWTDSEVHKKSKLKHRQIEFNSDEYFALLSEHPDVATLLSLGNEIDVVIGDTLCSIR